MKLSEALPLISEGKQLRRKSWMVRDVRILLGIRSASMLSRECHTETDRTPHTLGIVAAFGYEKTSNTGAPLWAPTAEDLLAEDYEIYTPPDVLAVDVESTGFNAQGLRTVTGEVA